MKNACFNKDFLDQFRQEYIVYPCVDERLYRNFLFRQFTGQENEIPRLGNWLAGMTSGMDINRCIIDNLKRENMPASAQLLRFVRNFNHFLCSCAEEEPFTAQYYHLLLADLNPFFALITSFRKKIQLNLINELEALLADEMNAGNTRIFIDKGLNKMLAEIEEYSGQVWKYYDYFIFLLKGESGNGRGFAISSEIEEYLVELISLTEQLLITTECIQSGLKNWQIKLSELEAGMLYN